MEIIRSQKRVQTYGRIRDRAPMTRVLMFVISLGVFIFFLTLAKGFIVDKPVPSPFTLTGAFSYPVSDFQETTDERETFEQKPLSDEEKTTINNQILSLANNDVVRELPEKAQIALYTNEVIYTIEKNTVTLGAPTDPDASIHLKTSYAQNLAQDFCGTIKEANKKGGFRVEQHRSYTALTWKYKSMLKHKNCLGF